MLTGGPPTAVRARRPVRGRARPARRTPSPPARDLVAQVATRHRPAGGRWRCAGGPSTGAPTSSGRCPRPARPRPGDRGTPAVGPPGDRAGTGSRLAPAPAAGRPAPRPPAAGAPATRSRTCTAGSVPAPPAPAAPTRRRGAPPPGAGPTARVPGSRCRLAKPPGDRPPPTPVAHAVPPSSPSRRRSSGMCVCVPLVTVAADPVRDGQPATLGSPATGEPTPRGWCGVVRVPFRGRAARMPAEIDDHETRAQVAGEASAAAAETDVPTAPAPDLTAAAFFDVDNTMMHGRLDLPLRPRPGRPQVLHHPRPGLVRLAAGQVPDRRQRGRRRHARRPRDRAGLRRRPPGRRDRAGSARRSTTS